jgi:hypothetical protein
LLYGGVPILHDCINITILGETVGFVSLTCHETVTTGPEATILESSLSALQKARPEIGKLPGIDETQPVVGARLLYVASFDLRSPEAEQDVLEYRLAWAVTFQMPPGERFGSR